MYITKARKAKNLTGADTNSLASAAEKHSLCITRSDGVLTRSISFLNGFVRLLNVSPGRFFFPVDCIAEQE